MRAVPLGGARYGAKALYWVVDDARGRSQWGLRWSPRWGHEALYWVVDDACGRSHWVVLVGALYASRKCCIGLWMTHGGGPAVTFGGVPYGATK
eukprot:9472833-Pyramimonas_sp.AAC.1